VYGGLAVAGYQTVYGGCTAVGVPNGVRTVYGRSVYHGLLPLVYGTGRCTTGCCPWCTDGVRIDGVQRVYGRWYWTVYGRWYWTVYGRLVFFWCSSPGLRLAFGGDMRLTLAPRARVSPHVMPPNGPSATGSGVWKVWQTFQTVQFCTEVVD